MLKPSTTTPLLLLCIVVVRYLIMSKYILNFSELKSNGGVDCIKFTSAKKRKNYIADRVIGINPERVFTLIVSYDDKDSNACDVYIFDKWSCIQEVVNTRWKSFFLFEWYSYEEAYKNALDLKEVNHLCYS